MSEESKEPDDAPIQQRHVDQFLAWYGSRCQVPKYPGLALHWFNALHTLTLGDLREGARFVAGMSKPHYIEPQKFWHLCKRRRPPEVVAKFRSLREVLIDRQEMKNVDE